MRWPWRRRPRLPHVEVVRVRPGDTLVFTSERQLSMEVIAHIQARWRATNPHLADIPVVVVENLGIKVIRREDNPQPTPPSDPQAVSAALGDATGSSSSVAPTESTTTGGAA